MSATSAAADLINQFAQTITKNPQLFNEPKAEHQETHHQPQRPSYDSGIPTYGQQYQVPYQPYGMLPSQWHNQAPRNPINITDEEISALARLSVLFQVRIEQIFTQGVKYFLIKTLRRNKIADEQTIKDYELQETSVSKEDYENAQERIERLEELESFESEMTIEDFENLLITLKTAELKQQRDDGTLQMPSTWGVTFNLAGLNISKMFGSNFKIFGDLVYAFKKK